MTSVGTKLMTSEDKQKSLNNAEELHIQVDIQDDQRQEVPDLKETMEAFEKSVETLRFQAFDQNSQNLLRKLPLWDNFKRWENLLIMGLMLTSDVIEIDEAANKEMEIIIDECKSVLN